MNVKDSAKTIVCVEQLQEILKWNRQVWGILEKASLLEMSNWYLAAGCVSQTVWNKFHDFEPNYGIQDYDLIYYDADTTQERQNEYSNKAKELFNSTGVKIEVVNQARVNLWFKDYFSYEIAPYQSPEESIGSWSAVASCVGVRYKNGEFKIYAPYGLNDIFDMIIRPNKATVFTKELYETKASKWLKMWPKLKVLPWDSQ